MMMHVQTNYMIAQEKYRSLNEFDAHLFHMLGMLIEPDFGVEDAKLMLETTSSEALSSLNTLVSMELIQAVGSRFTMRSSMRKLAENMLAERTLEIQAATRMRVIQWYVKYLRSKGNKYADADIEQVVLYLTSGK